MSDDLIEQATAEIARTPGASWWSAQQAARRLMRAGLLVDESTLRAQIAAEIEAEPAKWSRFIERNPYAVITDAARIARKDAS